MKRQSNALWPAGVCNSKYGDNISTDTHETQMQAKEVCNVLKREGFGGMRQHFPVVTWVSDMQQPPKLPDNLGCLNHDCPSHKECWRFMHGNCDGEFEPRLNSDRCDWFKEMK